MSSHFVALYGRFSPSMKPISVRDVSKKLAPFITNNILTIPQASSLDTLFSTAVGGTKFLQIQLANGRKINILNDAYRFDIKVDLLSYEKPLSIVYAVYINPRSNWRGIIAGQLADIRRYGLLDEADLYLHITDVHHTKGVLPFIKRKAGTNAVITHSFTNQFEYPAIKLLYDCATRQPGKTYLYFHTKGMSYNIKKRRRQERTIMAGSFENWRKNVEGFENPAVNKIGLYPAQERPDWGGWVWYNFFIARGSYLCKCEDPVLTTDRYYYESWLGKYKGIMKMNDGYSSFTQQKENFTQQQAADHLITYTDTYIKQQKAKNFFLRLLLPWLKVK